MTKVTLETILQDYFGCKKPFLKNPHYDNEELVAVTMTEKGKEAYSKLIDLLEDLDEVVGIRANEIIDELDEISSDYEWESYRK